jgi:hypothetical protein
MKSKVLGIGFGVGLLSALALTLPACGDDDGGSTPTGTGGTAGTGGATGSGGSSTAGAAGTPGFECPKRPPAPATQDACTTDGQEDKLANSEYGGKKVSAIASSCGVGCIADPDPVTCANTCIQDQVQGDITEECTGCVALQVACAIGNCVSVCAADSSSPACIACRCECDCVSVYESCSGIPQTTCD